MMTVDGAEERASQRDRLPQYWPKVTVALLIDDELDTPDIPSRLISAFRSASNCAHGPREIQVEAGFLFIVPWIFSKPRGAIEHVPRKLAGNADSIRTISKAGL